MTVSKSRKPPNQVKGNETPLYQMVYQTIISQINDEIYTWGIRLPGEHQLCESFNVSRITIRRALSRLEDEGLVLRQPGKGTFVTRPSKVWVHKGDAIPLTEHISQENSAYEGRRIEFTYIPTPLYMNSGPDGYGPVVLKTSRLSLNKQCPVHLHTSYVPERLARHIDPSAVKDRPISDVLKENGIEVAEVELTIDATIADSGQAELLAVRVGDPLINARQLSRAPNGSPVEFALTLSRPDLFLYRFRSNERKRILAPISGLRQRISDQWP